MIRSGKYILTALFALGMTMTAAFGQSIEAMARSMGISQSQLDSYKTMYGGAGAAGMQNDMSVNSYTDVNPEDQQPAGKYLEEIKLLNLDPSTRYYVNSRGELVVDSLYTNLARREVFGRGIFTSKDLNFAQGGNIPTPVNYKLAPGDAIDIVVWGTSEAAYKLKVNTDGSIYIPKVGPMHVAGLTVEEADSRIKAKLSTIYGAGSNVKVGLAGIRSIRVNVAGEAALPGTYTLPSTASLFNALYNAGGTNDIGSLRDIKVYRGGKLVGQLDAYKFILNGDVSQNIRLEDNDVIIVEPNRNMVYTIGGVKRNMVFELLPGETLTDVINYAGGFNGDAFADNIRIYRRDGNGYHMRTVSTDAFAAEEMSDGDVAVIGKAAARFDNRITIDGAAWRPGNYELSDDINSLSKLIIAAGGLRPDAYLNRGYIIRVDDGFTSSVIPFDVMRTADGSMDLQLQPDDKVVIPSIYDMKEFPTVTVYGEVNFKQMPDGKRRSKPKGEIIDVIQEEYERSMTTFDRDQAESDALIPNRFDYKTVDTYAEFIKDPYKAQSSTMLKNDSSGVEKEITVNVLPYRANMSVTDAILMAGGLRESASESKVVVYRRIKDTKATAIPETVAIEYEFSISKDLNLDEAASNFYLEPFDEVYVRRSPGFIVQQRVNIGGEIVFPGDYVVTKTGQRLSEFIDKAGGLSTLAYAKGASLTRRKNEDELKRDKAIFDANQALRPFEDISKVQFNPEETYSVAINLESAMKKPGSSTDIILRDGDVINVPRMNASVKVSGAVAYPAAMSFEPGMSVKHYVNAAGGYAQNARKKPFIIYLNGSVAKASSGKIEPGCEIVVPNKFRDPNKMPAATMVALSGTLLGSLSTLALVLITAVK